MFVDEGLPGLLFARIVAGPMSQLQGAPKSCVHRDWFLFASSRKATRQSESDDVARTAGRCVAKSSALRGCVGDHWVKFNYFVTLFS